MNTSIRNPRRWLPLLALSLALAVPAYAALKAGATAPPVTAPATLAGKEFSFSLTDALKEGPIVLYFYPKAFTKGCSIEARKFAEATEQFKALGARVVGVSHDDIATLNKFSVADCSSKFALASDPDLKIASAYDAKLPLVGMSNRVSYVIVPDGTILYTYSAMSPDEHVGNTLDALRKWKAKQAG